MESSQSHLGVNSMRWLGQEGGWKLQKVGPGRWLGGTKVGTGVKSKNSNVQFPDLEPAAGVDGEPIPPASPPLPPPSPPPLPPSAANNDDDLPPLLEDDSDDEGDYDADDDEHD